MFLLLGGVFAAFGLIATLLISDPPSQSQQSLMMIPTDEKVEGGQKYSLTSMQVLRTSTFYMSWLGFFNITLSSGILQNYAKAYGLTFINDDHFFAKVFFIIQKN